MNSKKNQDNIIENIVRALKQQDDVPYKEGAWERFQQQHLNVEKKRVTRFSWVAIAASFLVVVGLGYFAGTRFLVPSGSEESPIVVTNVEDDATRMKGLNDSGRKEIYSDGRDDDGRMADIDERRETEMARLDIPVLLKDEGRSENMLISNLGDKDVILPIKDVPFLSKPMSIDADLKLSMGSTELPSNLSYNLHNMLRTEEVQPHDANKNFRFTEKFELGAFVSPSATDRTLNFGGGLLLSYNLSSKWSLRSGATLNQYEVGALRDPAVTYDSQVSNELSTIIASDRLNNSLQLANNSITVPNINAVSGKVRTLDIPVDFKYNVGKDLYATAGVSYALVLSQERFSHYIENINSNTFVNGNPETSEDVQSAVRAVSRTVKSLEPNVETNGFSGFVNFSIGKKVPLKKALSLSVEPFVKLPIGQFKKADMDYSNGGIRIITSF